MNPCVFSLSPSSDSDDESNISKSNPLSLPKVEFKRRFRLSKEAFKYVLEKISFAGHMSTSVPPVLKLAATLNLLASGSFQHNEKNDFLLVLAQSICKVVNNVAVEIQNKLCPIMIQFVPNVSEECMEYFMEKFKIPGVVGCVDGTHFGIQAPTENEYMFFNRKGFHSLSSMIICDHKYKILSINSMYGGAAHDSFVWKHSEERRRLEQMYTENGFNVWVLGDSGYPTESWCIIPYAVAAEGSAEAYFNEVHAKARCIVELTIGILEGRWRILCNERMYVLLCTTYV